MSLGAKIRELRIAKGFTQSDLGSGLVTPSMISQIESDKANPSYKVLEAIAEKLETPLEHFLADVQTQLEQTSAHKVAKALLSAQNYERAVKLLEALLEKPTSSLNLLEVRSDLGECYLQLGRYEQATQLYEQMLISAQEKDYSLAMLQALNKLGLIEQKRQKYHMAIFYWRKAYECFEKLPHPEPFLQSQILTNLGMIHYQLGEFEDALKYYNDAYQKLASSNHFEEIGFTYVGLGLSYKKIHEFEKAAEYSQYAIAIFESLKNVKLAIDVKRNYAVLKGEEGLVNDALLMFKQCIKEYEKHNYLADVAITHGEIARLHLREKHFEDCKRACLAALHTLSAGAAETAPILRTLGLALEATGEQSEAIAHLERAVQVFAEHHLLAELAETYSLLSDLYMKEDDLRQANRCLLEMKKALTENLKERGILL